MSSWACLKRTSRKNSPSGRHHGRSEISYAGGRLMCPRGKVLTPGFSRECRTPDLQEARGGARSPRRWIEVPTGSQSGSREGQPRWQRGIHRSYSTRQTGGRTPEKWDQGSPPTSIPKAAGNPRKVDPERIWLGCSAGSHPLARHCPISAPSEWFLHPTAAGTEKQEGGGQREKHG